MKVRHIKRRTLPTNERRCTSSYVINRECRGRVVRIRKRVFDFKPSWYYARILRRSRKLRNYWK